MDIAEPRTTSRSLALRFSSSFPWKRTLPEARPLAASRPMMASRIWLLPEPDSPTMPTTSPRRRSKPTPSTAVTHPCGSLKRIARSRTARIGAAVVGTGRSALVRVEGIAQPVGNVVEAEQHGGKKPAGQQQHPHIGLDLLRAVGDERAPARRRRLHA